MDEPTAALTDRETDALFALIAKLKAQGVAFVYISHRLEELPRIADRITVLRDGRAIETRAAAAMPQDELIRLMVGRELDAHFPDLPPVARRCAGAVGGARPARRDQRRTASRSTFTPARSSAWPDWSARDAPRSCARSPVPTSHRAGRRGRRPARRRPRPARGIAAGIAFITEDRKAQGLVLGMSVRENTTLAHLDAFSRGPFIDRAAEVAVTAREIAELHIRTPSTEQLVRNLSGGNQQKVVLAKWLIGDRARVSLRRADARDRRRCEGRDLRADAGALGTRRRDRDGLERAARSARDVAPHPGRARRRSRGRVRAQPRRRPTRSSRPRPGSRREHRESASRDVAARRASAAHGRRLHRV